MESLEGVDITIHINGMELSAMKVAQLRALLEKRCETVPGKKKIILKNTFERVLLQERVLQVSS